jgi:hypothetical protein
MYRLPEELMKLLVPSRALLGSCVAVAVFVPSLASAARPTAPTLRRAEMIDTARLGVSGKLRGTLFSYLTKRPFASKVNGRIGQYVIGFWPGERGRVLSQAYRNPSGFFEVTPANKDAFVSEHFRVRDFLTKGQVDTWPKYLVLREQLVDKLELVIDELNNSGITVKRMTVMSGFRTPAYNGPGGEGRSGVSRHMYGDAADVFVDNDGNGRMDDLNRDGRVDHRDARVILTAVERVERRYPVLAGGVGVYRANSAHGPFAHVDVRGWRARWGLIG